MVTSRVKFGKRQVKTIGSCHNQIAHSHHRHLLTVKMSPPKRLLICVKTAVSRITDAVSSVIYNEEDEKCILPNQAIEYEKQSGPLILLEKGGFHCPVVSSSASASCAVVSTRIWQKYDDNIFLYHNNCYFNKGFDIEEPHQILGDFLRSHCIEICSANPNCSHFSYHDNFTCVLKKAPLLTDRVETEGNGLHYNGCGYISERGITFNLNQTSDGNGHWRKDCEFALPRIGSNSSIQGISAGDCLKKCFIN